MSVLTAVSDIKQSIVQNRQGHHGDEQDERRRLFPGAQLQYSGFLLG